MIENQHFPFSMQPLLDKVTQEKWSVWSLEGGLESLCDDLALKLKKYGVDIKENYAIQKEDVASNGTVGAESGFTFWSTPAYVTAQNLSCNAQLLPLLESIPYVDVAVVNVMFKGT